MSKHICGCTTIENRAYSNNVTNGNSKVYDPNLGAFIVEGLI